MTGWRKLTELERLALARLPFFFRLIQGTIDQGCPPRSAVKWWMYIWQRISDGAASEEYLDGLRRAYVVFLWERGLGL